MSANKIKLLMMEIIIWSWKQNGSIPTRIIFGFSWTNTWKTNLLSSMLRIALFICKKLCVRQGELFLSWTSKTHLKNKEQEFLWNMETGNKFHGKWKNERLPSDRGWVERVPRSKKRSEEGEGRRHQKSAMDRGGRRNQRRLETPHMTHWKPCARGGVQKATRYSRSGGCERREV